MVWTAWRKGIAVVLCMSMLGFLCTSAAWAAEEITQDNRAQLYIQYQVDGGDGDTQPAAGLPVQIYRVASVSPQGVYSLTEQFESYPVIVNGLDHTGWRALADTLAAYAARDGIKPLLERRTDSMGQVQFSDLEVGLYLVKGQSCKLAGKTWRFESFLVSLPSQSETGQWLYTVYAAPKFEGSGNGGGSDSDNCSYTVQKLWRDDGQELERPASVTVQLLKDGAVYDTVRLTADNNWRFTWNELSNDGFWQLAEQEISGYTVTVERQGNVFAVTNSRVQEPPVEEPVVEEPGKKPDEPGEDGIIGKQEPSDAELLDDDVPRGGAEPEGAKLPQTGVLWWPVPLLAGGGLLCYLIGWKKSRK